MKILISAGDYSADLHAQSLAKELKSLQPDLHLLALGGGKLQTVSNEFIANLVEMDISGFSKPLLKLPQLLSLLYGKIFPKLASGSVDAVILVDYYDFNIQIARKAKKHGIPVFYFISPQVWASRESRIQELKKTVSRMLVIFPFEEELYQSHGVPVTYIGHPFLETLPAPNHKKDFQSILQNGTIHLGLMPGSRKRELEHHLPAMLTCAHELKKKFPKLECSLFAADWIADEVYAKFMDIKSVQFVRENNFEKRSQLTLSLTASGTATLENALLGIPMVVVYHTSWITYRIAMALVKVNMMSMPNILSGKMILPELLQSQLTPEDLLRQATYLIEHPPQLEKMREELIELRKMLGDPGAYARAAKIIMSELK